MIEDLTSFYLLPLSHCSISSSKGTKTSRMPQPTVSFTNEIPIRSNYPFPRKHTKSILVKYYLAPRKGSEVHVLYQRFCLPRLPNVSPIPDMLFLSDSRRSMSEGGGRCCCRPVPTTLADSILAAPLML